MKSQRELYEYAFDHSVVAIARAPIDRAGLPRIDRIQLNTDDRVLVAGQLDEADNGLYTAQRYSWNRTIDGIVAEHFTEVCIAIRFGSTYAETFWVPQIAEAASFRLGVSSIRWTQMGQSWFEARRIARGEVVAVVPRRAAVGAQDLNLLFRERSGLLMKQRLFQLHESEKERLAELERIIAAAEV